MSFKLNYIGPGEKAHLPLGVGGSFYGPDQLSGQHDAELLAAMSTAFEHGLTHFDTAADYGDGASERLIGRFIASDDHRRERIFLASKVNPEEISAASILKAVDASRDRLQVDVIDLYYIHWPRTNKDLRPLMEGLQTAREQGKIRAVGISNFSVEQMQQISECGRIDAHQLGYNLLWRFPESDIIPYCVEHDIAVVVYSALAHGILAGKYRRELAFAPGDQRYGILHFRSDLWPEVYEAMTAFKNVAEEAERPLAHLALRWLLHQPAVTSVLVSAKNARQAAANAQALEGHISQEVFDTLSAISDRARQYIPDEGNPFGYHP